MYAYAPEDYTARNATAVMPVRIPIVNEQILHVPCKHLVSKIKIEGEKKSASYVLVL